MYFVDIYAIIDFDVFLRRYVSIERKLFTWGSM